MTFSYFATPFYSISFHNGNWLWNQLICNKTLIMHINLRQIEVFIPLPNLIWTFFFMSIELTLQNNINIKRLIHCLNNFSKFKFFWIYFFIYSDQLWVQNTNNIVIIHCFAICYVILKMFLLSIITFV